jgi:hypothetical protein
MHLFLHLYIMPSKRQRRKLLLPSLHSALYTSYVIKELLNVPLGYIPWRQRQQIPPKRWCLSTTPYSATFEKTTILMLTTVRPSDHMNGEELHQVFSLFRVLSRATFYSNLKQNCTGPMMTKIEFTWHSCLRSSIPKFSKLSDMKHADELLYTEFFIIPRL